MNITVSIEKKLIVIVELRMVRYVQGNQEMEIPESQIKDSQLMRQYLEQPVHLSSSSSSSLRVERSMPPTLRAEKASVPEMQNMDEEDDDLFMFTRSTLNLLIEWWNPSKTMLQNFKIVIGFVQSCIINRGRIDPNDTRMREGKIIKDVMVNVLDVWKKKRKRGCNTACSLEELNIFIAEEKLGSILSEDIMTESTYNEWLEDFKEFIGQRPTLRVDATAAKPSSGEEGLNGLFNVSNFKEEEADGRLPQYIAKLENGRFHTVRTPGEVGHSLVRLDMYDVREISKKEKRDWWKYANLRTQFLMSSPTDSKQQLVKQLLDLAADDLSGVPGLRKEVNSVIYQ